MRTVYLASAALAAPLALMVAAQPALAQQTAQAGTATDVQDAGEIVVTAAKRSENL